MMAVVRGISGRMREQVELEWWDRESWMRNDFLRNAGNRLKR